MSNYQYITVEAKGDACHIVINPGRYLKLSVANELCEELFSAAEAVQGSIIINFQDVEYFSSRVSNRLITLNNRYKEARGTVCFCNLRDELVDFLTVSRLQQIFRIEDSLESALKSLEESKKKKE